MKIEFSPSQIQSPASPGPATRPASLAGGTNAVALDTTAALKDQLNALPVVRPDKVSGALSLVARQHYPPEDLMDRIATLLAFSLPQ